MCFSSIKDSCLYLTERGIQCEYQSVIQRFNNKKIAHGYQFLYFDASKYETKVKDELNEKWKKTHIKTSDRYTSYVSNFGRVKIIKEDGTEILKKQYRLKGEYRYVWLPNANTKHVAVHQLVANAFI
eukprot:418189_1